MKRIVTILTEGFAEWEIGVLAGAARNFYGLDVQHASPGGLAVTSAGGLRVMPDLATEDIDLATTDALVVCGSTLWQTESAPDISGLLREARERRVVIAGICDATRALAGAGLLDRVEHTSNSLETLLETKGYAGKISYWDVPHAVASDGIITAPGSAPVSFMAEVLEGLGIADHDLDFYLGLLAAEHAGRNHLSANRPAHRAAAQPG